MNTNTSHSTPERAVASVPQIRMLIDGNFHTDIVSAFEAEGANIAETMRVVISFPSPGSREIALYRDNESNAPTLAIIRNAHAVRSLILPAVKNQNELKVLWPEGLRHLEIVVDMIELEMQNSGARAAHSIRRDPPLPNLK